MGITSKLCNATPFEVKINWEPGRPLKINGDGFVELTHDQLLDFRPGQPGSEEISRMTSYFGVFLLDSDRSYDVQALEAIKKAASLREEEYRIRMQNLRAMRTASGMKPDEDTMQELERQTGLNRVREEAETLRKREKILSAAVGTGEERVKQKIDLSKTCLATSPPREFASETALKIFLEENPEIKEKHETLVAAMEDKNVKQATA